MAHDLPVPGPIRRSGSQRKLIWAPLRFVDGFCRPWSRRDWKLQIPSSSGCWVPISVFGSGGWRFGAEPKSSNWVSLGSSPGLYIAALGSPHMVLLSWSRGNLCNLSFSPILCTFLEVAIIEGSFEVKLPTICTQSAQNCRKVAKHRLFLMFWDSGGSKK